MEPALAIQAPLPWLAEPLRAVLAGHRGHALLVQGAAGVGTWPFLLAVAQAWLCETPAEGRAASGGLACGHCGSCHLVQSRVHPDLTVLLPETLRRSEGWPLADDKPDAEDSKRKPSKQIRIDDVRALIEASTRTSGRGRGKAMLLHPVEAMNHASASALLKTLEEPAAGTRLLLGTADAELLLPTVRSRCQLLRLTEPPPAQATAWLAEQGLADRAEAAVLLAACAGRPLDALALHRGGTDAAVWQALPQAVVRGQAQALSGWPVPRVVDALQKLCHDALAVASGAPPRYFPAAAVPQGTRRGALLAWWAELQRLARHDEHPWNEPLLIEALVGAGARALARRGSGPADAVHPVPLRYTARS